MRSMGRSGRAVEETARHFAVFANDVFTFQTSHGGRHFVYRQFFFAAHMLAVAVRVAEIEHVNDKRRFYPVHVYVSKVQIGQQAAIAASAPCFQPQTAVGVVHQALFHPKSIHTGRNFTADNHRAVAALQKAVADLQIAARLMMHGTHVILAAFDGNAVVADRDFTLR